MAQGKLKIKTNLPMNIKNKKTGKKGNAVTKRTNRPIQSKKKGVTETRKLKQVVKRTVNKAVEEEIRLRVSNECNKPLSTAQQAIAEHNLKLTTGPA
ncbi:DUF2462 domain containing protein [Asbolus verrucosus]|uniref:DUF2462 domain containing protein n=1 Tax=Asbolus verrucosus TaxID=1661398 RepID=A0A482V1D5_ASBVE|nr:DUF2462 domain containing protein [Asbolus verrucosus]